MELVERCIAANHGYFELANEVTAVPGGALVTSADCPDVYDANCVTRPTAATEAEVDALLAAVDQRCRHQRHRCFKLDSTSPPRLEARLVLEGYEPMGTEVQLVLEDELDVDPPTVDIRPVTDDGDWASLRSLLRADHVEQRGDEWPESLTDQIWQQKRRKSPDVQFFLARVDSRDCGFFSAWPGLDGVGKVEDLYVVPERRRRGIATALIAHCVDDARRRGASLVTIGADVDDTPKAMYAALGFRPIAIHRSYVKTL